MNLLSYKLSLKFDVTKKKKKKKDDSSYTKRFKSFKSEQIIEIYTTLMTNDWIACTRYIYIYIYIYIICNSYVTYTWSL